MTTTIEALQNLYVAEGGELSDVANLVTIPDMINALAALKVANNAASEASNSEDTSTSESSSTSDSTTNSENEGGN